MSKIVKINESQKRRLFEAYSDGFSFDELTELGKQSLEGINCSPSQIRYCTKYLGASVGEGSSRMVYTLSDNMILKLAYGHMYQAGIEQNKLEWKLFREAQSSLLPRIYGVDDNFTYLICESVNPADYTDFEKILGIPYMETYVQHSEKIQMTMGKEGDSKVGYDKYFDNLKGIREKYNGYCAKTILDYITYRYALFPGAKEEELEKNMEKNNRYAKRINIKELEWVVEKSDWFSEIKRLSKKFGLYDFGITNFGIVNRYGTPKIVILDSGFNPNISKKYYRGR